MDFLQKNILCESQLSLQQLKKLPSLRLHLRLSKESFLFYLMASTMINRRHWKTTNFYLFYYDTITHDEKLRNLRSIVNFTCYNVFLPLTPLKLLDSLVSASRAKVARVGLFRASPYANHSRENSAKRLFWIR